MRALARRSGLSTNALSMIERGRTSPSVSTLYKLSEALEVPITAFFRIEPPRQSIVFLKSDQHPRVEFPRGRWEGLGGESFLGRVEPFMLNLEPGATSGPHGLIHSGHEFVLLLEGHLEYEVEVSASCSNRAIACCLFPACFTAGAIPARLPPACCLSSPASNRTSTPANTTGRLKKARGRREIINEQLR